MTKVQIRKGFPILKLWGKPADWNSDHKELLSSPFPRNYLKYLALYSSDVGVLEVATCTGLALALKRDKTLTIEASKAGLGHFSPASLTKQ